MTQDFNETRFVPSVRLTPVEMTDSSDISIVVTQLIAYSQNEGFTRLRLTGGKMLDVKETTDRIDYLVRYAATSQT
jgi:hypothetical protein